MFWVLMALLVVAAGVLLRGRGRTVVEDEPWRASLDEGDDEPLDMEEIRRAEDEWLAEESAAESWREDEGEEDWR